jgi:hypothetical protein
VPLFEVARTVPTGILEELEIIKQNDVMQKPSTVGDVPRCVVERRSPLLKRERLEEWISKEELEIIKQNDVMQKPLTVGDVPRCVCGKIVSDVEARKARGVD